MSYQTVQLATDLVPVAAEGPWVHALRIAAAGQSPLRVMHAGDVHPWKSLRPAEDYLVRWGCKPVAVERSELDGFVADVVPKKLEGTHDDLLVLGTHRPSGLARLVYGSVAEWLVRQRGDGATLVVPDGVRPLVDENTGKVELAKVLVPIGDVAHQQLAVDAAVRLARTLGAEEVEFILLHRSVSDQEMPYVKVPEGEGWSWRREELPSTSVVAAILEGTVRWDASLIVMVSHGHDGLDDALFGSQTERVLHETTVPMLIVRP